MEEILIQIVDEYDKPIRGGSMDEAQLNGLWHRVAGVMVYDDVVDKFLIQKISPNPYYNGGKWNITATGHVDNGESYETAALRELSEEMGVRDLKLAYFSYYKVSKKVVAHGLLRTYNRFYKIFTARADSSDLLVSPDTSEVEDYMWASLREIANLPKSRTLTKFLDMYSKNVLDLIQ